MLYKLTTKQPFKDNPELLTIDEFKDLSEREMLYVIYYTDKKSPYRHLPDHRRKRSAATQAGWGLEKGNRERADVLEKNARTAIASERVVKAVEYYKSLMYDPSDEDVEIIALQIENIKKTVRDAHKLGTENALDAAELKKINDLLESLPTLRKTQREILKVAGIEAPDAEDFEVKKELSEIDEYNQEQQLKDN